MARLHDTGCAGSRRAAAGAETPPVRSRGAGKTLLAVAGAGLLSWCAPFAAFATGLAATDVAENAAVDAAGAGAAAAEKPRIVRLTPPSEWFASGDPNPPILARFLSGQRFDLQATVVPAAGQSLREVRFMVDGAEIEGPIHLVPASGPNAPAGAWVATCRAFASERAGVRSLSVKVRQSNGAEASATGNFEIVAIGGRPERRARNIILLIGDGFGLSHRTAARLMLAGARQGKFRQVLAMDRMPWTALVATHSLNSVVTDSSPGAACYASGNKSNNNEHGVFPDDTAPIFDNPRVELIGEYLWRTDGRVLGIVTTADVFDSTPSAFAAHTQNRAAGTGICDQYLDEAAQQGLVVLLGGGRKWFLPNSEPGSARTKASDFQHEAELASAWGIACGRVDPERDLLADFQAAGWHYVPDAAALRAAEQPRKLLGLFALSNMFVALDKIEGRRGTSTMARECGFPDQPMLDEMTQKALEVLEGYSQGFVLMVEAASIDKQTHNMDSERAILDVIEFDRAIAVALEFAARHPDTLVVQTADHECGGFAVIGTSLVTDVELARRGRSGGGTGQLRQGVVAECDDAGFPRYRLAADGYPETTNIDRRLLFGYAANADRFEDWRTNSLPLVDSQQPFAAQPPMVRFPSSPMLRDTAGGFLISGHMAAAVAAHTAADVPLCAAGRGAERFVGYMDNTEVFFHIMRAAMGAD